MTPLCPGLMDEIVSSVHGVYFNILYFLQGEIWARPLTDALRDLQVFVQFYFLQMLDFAGAHNGRIVTYAARKNSMPLSSTIGWKKVDREALRSSP